MRSFLALVLLTVTARAIAQTAPASAPSELKINITGVEGFVQVRDDENQPWKKCTVGMVVGPGAEFRTGPKSAVRCEIPPDQTFTVDRLGTMKVLQAMQQGGKVKTDLMMQYGRTRYDVEAAGVEHQSTIRSPSGTLALRGTRVSLYDQPPFTPRATSLTGRAIYQNVKRQIAFGGRGQGTTKVEGDKDSAAQTSEAIAQVQKYLDPKSAIEMTEAEARLLAFDISQGSIRFDRLVIGGFQPPPSDLAAAGLLPGKLNFVATWTGFADLDLFVIVNPNTPNQKILGNPSVSSLFPGLVQQTLPSGATVPFDKVSTQQGDYEIAYWPKANYGAGLYGIGIIHNDFRHVDPSYSAISDVKLEVYQDGKKISTVVTNPEEVLAGQALPRFGTTYSAQTNLNAGKDVLSTVAVVSTGEQSLTRARKTHKNAAPIKVAPVPRGTRGK